MDKLYKVELKTLGTIYLEDEEAFDHLWDLLLDAACRSSDLEYYANQNDHEKEAAEFQKDFNQRMEDVDTLGKIIEEEP